MKKMLRLIFIVFIGLSLTACIDREKNAISKQDVEILADSSRIGILDSLLVGIWKLGKMKYAKIKTHNPMGNDYHEKYALSYANKDIFIELLKHNFIKINGDTIGKWNQMNRIFSFKLNNRNDNFPLPSCDYAINIRGNILKLSYKHENFKYTYYLVGSPPLVRE